MTEDFRGVFSPKYKRKILLVQPMKLEMRSRTLQEDKAVNKFFDGKCRTVTIPVKEKPCLQTKNWK